MSGHHIRSVNNFVHLHLHTHYSVLDGLCKIPLLLERAKELGMQALAITDHGGMSGAIEFYAEAVKRDIKPIVGFEAYVAPGSRLDRDLQDNRNYHLTLLARNLTGYRNLSKLSTLGYTEGFYHVPRVDKEILRNHNQGVIALSGCIEGEVNQYLLAGQMDEAESVVSIYREIFGPDNFFLEVMNNGLEEQTRIIPALKELSRRTGIPLVATSDVHYIMHEHSRAHAVHVCIGASEKLSKDRRKHLGAELYLKSGEQMLIAFKGMEDACERSVEIAARCNLELPFEGIHLPRIALPAGMSASQYLNAICCEGLKTRYGQPLPQEVAERYEHEMSVITAFEFSDYFLFVWDFAKFAHEHDIAIGPGRGSAPGSIVAYALGITKLDPLKYGLLFERFLEPDRNKAPDISLDLDREQRDEIIEYIIQRHGWERCARVVTFGNMSLHSAVRETGRVLGIPLPEVETIDRMIPGMLAPRNGKNRVQMAMELIPCLRELYNKNPHARELLDIAGQLEGTVRQKGIHACGLLVTDEPINEYGPLARREEAIITQYESKILEKMGLCRVDLFGLDILTVLRKAVADIKHARGIKIDLDSIRLDDYDTFQMLQKGEVIGVYQFESTGMCKLFVKLKPDCFEELIAVIALYRPGLLATGMVDRYIACKQGQEEPQFLHPQRRWSHTGFVRSNSGP